MLKTKSKIVLFVIALIILISTICYATEGTTPGENARVSEGEPVVTSEENPTPIDETSEAEISSDPEIYNGDLYLFSNDVVMDKLVDGNVFIFGQNVEITGRVNGSLFVCANKVTFGEDSYIVQSIYVAANEVVINGAANDLYAVAKKIDMNYNSFMIRDLKVATNEFNFKGGVGRNAFVKANNFDFSKEEGASAIVYGDLEYSSANELELSKDLVQGEIKYSKMVEEDNTESIGELILEKIIDLLEVLLLTTVIFFLITWLAPKFVEKSSSFVGKKSLSSFGIGLAGFVITILVSFGLLFSVIGIPLALLVFGIFAIIMFIASAITTICITYKLNDTFKIDKKYMTYLVLIIVTLSIWILQQIPYIAGIISIIVTLAGFGTLITYIFEIAKKEKAEVK